ncbi:Lrp/AsnC family transcriptional regulator [Halomonas desiderata]|uniref:siroheme decarboxylase n=1 Tax=Billgrantia desiderata TaxID=52021 RepID=A0ABS9B8J7_9GAMM|nr:Lrp/AsnC family transcriptional regulator [Halomonas desiderata]MCE8043756.1 Lrp/AsnC family transcriptional regulator [Halomonas desiderata]MCE8048330.1 Lrp/AsnC family transcriptional regulator [Halomonas desiderata]NIC35534.1 Lrp/AsnC family transcriptional regulator [Halomonas desiderata]
MAALDSLDRRLIDAYQRGLPLCERPFAAMAERLGASEAEVIERLQRLQQSQVLSRVGPVFDHARAGASLLAAVAVSEAERDRVAEVINRSPGVNHNYAREHDFNLWFVMTAADELQLEARLEALEAELGVPLLRLPMVEGYHIDLGFPIPWAELEAS